MNDLFSPESLEQMPHETPYFVFSHEAIRDTFGEYADAFPGAHIQYAVKANGEVELLKTLTDAGSGFEVASIYELDTLKQLGIPASRIIFGASVKPAAAIRAFYEYGVTTFAADSASELEKIAVHAPGSRVFIRIITDDAGSVFRFSEKFGTDKEQAVPLLMRARELGLIPYGISFHVGSQATNPAAWQQEIRALGPVISHLNTMGIRIEVLNIGGGFPTQYAIGDTPLTLVQIARSVHDAIRELPYQPTLMLEPGRGLVADTGIAVASIIGKVERREYTWLFLDLGVYNGLFETMAYQGSTRYRVSSMRPSYNAGEALFALAGPTGDSPDVITREALLPQDIGVGDKLIFHTVGAYSLVAASPFNGFPKPAVYFI